MEAEFVDTIICPQCHAELAASAHACDRCGAATTATKGARELINRPWVIILLMLHVGFLGIPVYWKTKYSLGARLLMIVASIVYTVAAVAAILLMLRWLASSLFG